ncbi:MAG: hypothetical protein PHY54_16910 [Methylococcales bacterium]|nr:hypothetical protein [Methylococcales bacterium]
MKKYILEDHGYFWWHDAPIQEGHLAPDSSVTGVLRIEEDGSIELELDGILWRDDNPMHSVFGNDTAISPEKCIQGLFKGSNKSVLLIDIFKNGGMLRTKGISYEKYQALNCLVGDFPFPRLGYPLKFCKLTVDMKGFHEWLRLGSIKSNRTKSRIFTKYNAPKDISYNLEDGKLSIIYGISGLFFGNDIRRSSLTLSERASINYAPTKSATLDRMKTQGNRA